MSYRLAKWHEIESSKRCFATLPGGERVWYRVTGFTEAVCGGGMSVQPMAKIVREGDDNSYGIYPVKALVFELSSGELVK
jgi:hypothetical protein